jgi:molybdenum cofactor cytidylyltransferase
MNSSTVGLIILAAGASTRMGTPKQLLAYRGCSFIRHMAEVAILSLPTHCRCSGGECGTN